jgi:hypothetical protein
MIGSARSASSGVGVQPWPGFSDLNTASRTKGRFSVGELSSLALGFSSRILSRPADGYVSFVAFVIAMKSLVPENIKQVLALIFYGGLLVGPGYFLVFTSRRPAPSEQKEAFRKPARIMAFGLLLLAAFALVLLTLTGPDS